MKRIDRRRFMLVASVGASGAVLTACGNTESTDANLNPTMIPDVAGAPPTLVPNATPGGGAEAAAQPADEAPAEDQTPAEQAPAEGGGEAASGDAGGPIQLEAQDPYDWSISQFEVAPGQVIEVTNVGVVEHTFAVDEWGLDEDLPNGEPVDIPVPDDAEVGATLDFYCSIPGHRELGMEGTLTVVEAGAAPPAAEESSPPAAAEGTPAEGGGQAASGGAGGPIQLEAQDPADWSIYEFEVAPGQVIEVTNVGVLPHTFAVDEWGMDENLPNGEAVDITVPVDAEVGATLDFYCSVTGHRELGMEGTLTIVQ